MRRGNDIHKVPAFLGCSKREPIFDLLMRQQLAEGLFQRDSGKRAESF